MNKKAQKGFTLIELLVVIAIIAVLSVVVILTLNPAELLRQARDSSRISDLNTLKSAIALFLADLNSTSSAALGTNTICYQSPTQGAASAGTSSASCDLSWFFVDGTSTESSSTTPGYVNGSGWIPVDFTAISSGAPIGNLPQDPTENANHLYVYTPDTSFQYELGTNMEASKYANGGGSDVESTDGGDRDEFYETGSSVRL